MTPTRSPRPAHRPRRPRSRTADRRRAGSLRWPAGLVRVLFASLVLAPLAGLAGCVTNPATGKQQLNFLSREQEIALGAEAMPQLVNQYGGEVRGAELRSYFQRVARELTPHVEEKYRDLPWEFTLLDSDVINAFALPGGKVFVTRGLAARMTNEAQLAGVLGHEIGHVTAEHADQRVSRNMMIQLGAVGVSIAAGESDSEWARAAVPFLISGAGVFALSYDREEELEADRLGMRYMHRAGYNPIGQLQLMRILRDAAGNARQPEFLSTHPHPETRIAKIEEIIEKKYPHALDGVGGFYEERFRSRFLAQLESLPPAAHRPHADDPDLELADASTWCAHCRSHH